MLVDMGDLPQPDNNVLSETLWNSELNAAAPSSVPNAAGVGLHGMHSGPIPSIITRPVGTYSVPYCCVLSCHVVPRFDLFCYYMFCYAYKLQITFNSSNFFCFLGQKIYRGKGAKQIAAELEAGELARNATLLSKNIEAIATSTLTSSTSSTSTSIGSASETMSGGLSDIPYSQDRGFYPHAKIALGEIMGPVPLRNISETDRFVSEQRGGTENDFPTSDSQIHAAPDSSNAHENGNRNENENENENSIRTAGQEEIEITSSSSSSMPLLTTHSLNTGTKENNDSDGVHQNNLSNQDDENENENNNGDEVDNDVGEVTQLHDTGMAEINVVDETNVSQTSYSDGMGSGSSAQYQEHEHEQQQDQSDSQSNNDNIITSERAKRKLGDTDFVNSSYNNNDNNMCSSSSSSNLQINREVIVDEKSVCAIRLNGSLIDTEFTKINNIVPPASTYQ